MPRTQSDKEINRLNQERIEWKKKYLDSQMEIQELESQKQFVELESKTTGRTVFVNKNQINYYSIYNGCVTIHFQNGEVSSFTDKNIALLK